MNEYTIAAIIFTILAAIFGAIGTWKASNADKKEIKEEFIQSEIKDSTRHIETLSEFEKYQKQDKSNSEEIKNQLLQLKEEILKKAEEIKATNKNEKPKVEFEFVHPKSLAYKVQNTSERTIAENVIVAFGIFDLNVIPLKPLPIPSTEINYINPESARGPWSILGKYSSRNHRYFGIMYLNCKGCQKLKTYWVYIEVNEKGNSFYAKRNENDTYEVQFGKLANSDKEYFDQLIPEERRIYIK